MTALTAKQEAFAIAFVETGNASEAYRSSYDVGVDTKPETVWNEASRTLGNPDVTARVFELQAEARERCLVTVESLTRELNEDRALAREVMNPAAAISAVLGKAKLHGLITDKAKTETMLKADDSISTLLSRIADHGKRLGGDV